MGYFFSFLQIIFEVLFLLITQNQTLIGSVLCWISVPFFVMWQLYKIKQCTIISSFPNFCKHLDMTFAVWTYLMFSTPLCLPLRCFTLSITITPCHICSELIRDAPLGVSSPCPCTGTPHMAQGQPWGLTESQNSVVPVDLVPMVSWINALSCPGHGDEPCLGQTLPSLAVWAPASTFL